MTTLATLATDGLAGLRHILSPSPEGTDDSSSASPADDLLRLLALLNPLLRTLVDSLADGVASSPVRATLLALLTEDLARNVGRAQIVAAGKIEESDAHTLKEAPLVQLRELQENLADFIEGGTPLPEDRRNSPGTKMLYRDAIELTGDQLHLSYVQAKQRFATRDMLLPRAGFNGSVIPPHFGSLSKVFNDGSADPQQVAVAARRLLALQPGIDAQEDPHQAAALVEQQVAESLVSHNSTGTNQLFKRIAARLDAQALENSESRMAAHLGLVFKGRQARGFIWELCTDLPGHEILSGVSDQIANPRSAFGSPREPALVAEAAQGSGGQPQLPGFADSASFPASPPIPEWAVDPETPEEERPRPGFGELDRESPPPGPAPELELLPGETAADARQRLKARALHQFFFDSMRHLAGGDANTSPDMPLLPTVDMVVTISWDSLIGKVDDPGATSHNQLVSAGQARRLACKANVIPAVLGTQSQPLDLGRTQRFFNRAQRRAMALRDKGCINPGCTMAAHRCEANHIKPWYLGGETNLSNGGLLCPLCHTSFHAGHFRIVVVGSIPYVVQSKARDPEQRLRRNWIFHPEAEVIQ